MAGWLAQGELRVGLGCMRLAEQADETIAAALDAGITVFDTARAYEATSSCSLACSTTRTECGS